MRAIKSLGQNFLVNPVTISKIITVVSTHPHETILEIGPGTGALTKSLAKISARLITVEKDNYLASQLSRDFNRDTSVRVINDDILTNVEHEWLAGTYVIVGSLPYNISKRIIKKFLIAKRNRPTHLHVVVQREVGEQYTAVPPQNSYLSSFARIYSEPKKNFVIPRTHFSPVPKVDGVFLTFTLKEPPPYHAAMNIFFKALFKNPRKTLKNNIDSYIDGLDQRGVTSRKRSLPSSIKENARAAELTFEQLSDLFFVYNTSYKYEN